MSGALSAGLALAPFVRQAITTSGLLGQLPAPLAALIGTPRSIGTIIPDVTIEEQHSDQVTITQHPVSSNYALNSNGQLTSTQPLPGSQTISDHAFRQPSTVTMRVGWTNSNLLGAVMQGAQQGLAGLAGGAGLGQSLGAGLGGAASGAWSAVSEQRCRQVYHKLVDMQHQCTLFNLTTGKRNYQNMIITGLSVTTDKHSEYSLFVECHMQEVIIVSTQVTTGQASLPASSNQSDQASPSDTSPTTDTGTERLVARPLGSDLGWRITLPGIFAGQ